MDVIFHVFFLVVGVEACLIFCVAITYGKISFPASMFPSAKLDDNFKSRRIHRNGLVQLIDYCCKLSKKCLVNWSYHEDDGKLFPVVFNQTLR